MPPGGEHTIVLEQYLAQMRQGDAAAAAEAHRDVIMHTLGRLEQLTRRMLRRYPHLRRWEQTDDVLQNAMLRLLRALGSVKPESARQFYGLAATQIRRELIDLARHHFGPEGAGARHQTDGLAPAAEARSAPGAEPSTLAAWGEFHAAVERLPMEEREVFDLLWYQGLTQVRAAAVLQVSEKTVKNRWRNAKLLLRRLLDEEFSHEDRR